MMLSDTLIFPLPVQSSALVTQLLIVFLFFSPESSDYHSNTAQPFQLGQGEADGKVSSHLSLQPPCVTELEKVFVPG